MILIPQSTLYVCRWLAEAHISPWYSSSMPSKVLTTKTWWLWTAIILDLPQFITSHIFLSERAFYSDIFAYFLARDIWGFKACFINHIFLLFSSYIPSHPSSIKNFFFANCNVLWRISILSPRSKYSLSLSLVYSHTHSFSWPIRILFFFQNENIFMIQELNTMDLFPLNFLSNMY